MTENAETLPGMIGRHPRMLEVYRMVRKYAAKKLPIAIVGETGTGKELVARAIHELGGSPNQPFIDINCAAIPETLAEGELFGWERGAFTGAHGVRVGLVEAAHGGTLFLDEVSSLSMALQAKLLRVIEQKEIRRLGSKETRRAEFRILVACSEPLPLMVQTGRFRADFSYRVSTVTIRLPALRERTSDIRELGDHFLALANDNGHGDKILDDPASAMLERHSWPGNLRQLRATMERVEAECHGRVITQKDIANQLGELDTGFLGLAEALDVNGWDVTKTAKMLGQARSTVYEHIKEMGLERPSR